MNVAELVFVVRARWRIVVALTVLGIAAGLVSAVVTPNVYESSTSVYISSQAGGDDVTKAYQGGLLSQERVKSYTELISSNRLGEDVRNDLGLPESPREIAEEISANATVDTVVITVRVDSRTPQRAAAIANSASRNFERLVAQLEAPPNRSGSPAVVARVVQGAEIQPEPVSPSYALDVALGVLAGLAVGVAAALAAHRTDRRVKGSKQAEALAGVRLLGTVPHDPQLASDPLPVHHRPHSPVAESFRQVRTSLRLDHLGYGPTVLMVTSSVPGEGRTTSASNLAIAFANDGARVVLVETDLRSPRLATTLGLTPSLGLSTILTEKVRLEGAVQSWGGLMSVIPGGPLPPNPSELLGSPAMRELLARLREHHDMVILDSPPMRTVADAAVLSGLADAALLVCRDGKTDASDLSRTAAELRRTSARLVGVVVVGGWRDGRADGVGHPWQSHGEGPGSSGPPASVLPRTGRGQVRLAPGASALGLRGDSSHEERTASLDMTDLRRS